MAPESILACRFLPCLIEFLAPSSNELQCGSVNQITLPPQLAFGPGIVLVVEALTKTSCPGWSQTLEFSFNIWHQFPECSYENILELCLNYF